MAYKMVSKYGNAIYIVKTERERDEFKKRGFTEESGTSTGKAKGATKKKTSTKRGIKYDNEN